MPLLWTAALRLRLASPGCSHALARRAPAFRQVREIEERGIAVAHLAEPHDLAVFGRDRRARQELPGSVVGIMRDVEHRRAIEDVARRDDGGPA